MKAVEYRRISESPYALTYSRMRSRADAMTTASSRSRTVASCRNVRWCAAGSLRSSQAAGRERGEHEGAGRHELEEAAAGVLGIGEAARGEDERGAAEQVAQLNDHEDEKQQVHQAQRRRH